jgi:hypothetical protein
MGKTVLVSQYLNVATDHFDLVLNPQRLHRTKQCVRALGAAVNQGHPDFGANNGNHQARNSCPATQINAGCDSNGQSLGKRRRVFNNLGQGGRPQCSYFLGLAKDTAKTRVVCGLHDTGFIV